MTVRQLSESLALEVLSLPEPEREVCGAYAGDLLSWVMGRANADNVWVTVMTNANTVAVATLTDVSMVIVTDGSEMPPETLALAKEKGVNLARTKASSYEICVRLGGLLS
ncbi:MAG: hypothetical protein IKC43_00270 [Clostridia bacterium]|nr:hypothetical protein [Clostridia bacterium]